MERHNVFLIYGWKTSPAVVFSIVPEARELGLEGVIEGRGKSGFIGKILSRASLEQDPEVVGVIEPSNDLRERLVQAIRVMKLESIELNGPLLWLVVG